MISHVQPTSVDDDDDDSFLFVFIFVSLLLSKKGIDWNLATSPRSFN